MTRNRVFASVAMLAATFGFGLATVRAADEKLPTYLTEEEAGADFKVQGEYQGKIKEPNGEEVKIGVQIIALGTGEFHAVSYRGGLPGDGWKKGDFKHEVDGKTANNVTTFVTPEGAKGVIENGDGVLKVYNKDGKLITEMKKVVRESSTLGAKPPEGAKVLFDGSTPAAFEGGKLTKDGLLMAGCKTNDKFKDFTLHVEFRTPFMPTARGQARGNSGVYLLNLYEIQVLDSFGLEGKNNECGGIYSVQDPALNMCYPPLSWQTYDVEFIGPRFDAAGKKTKNAVVTVKHNGTLVYENFELPKFTPGGAPEEGPMGPLYLQDHGNPVHYRNIWIVEKK